MHQGTLHAANSRLPWKMGPVARRLPTAVSTIFSIVLFSLSIATFTTFFTLYFHCSELHPSSLSAAATFAQSPSTGLESFPEPPQTPHTGHTLLWVSNFPCFCCYTVELADWWFVAVKSGYIGTQGWRAQTKETKSPGLCPSVSCSSSSATSYPCSLSPYTNHTYTPHHQLNLCIYEHSLCMAMHTVCG